MRERGHRERRRERGGEGRESREREERASRDEGEGERVQIGREGEMRDEEISVSLRVNGASSKCGRRPHLRASPR